MSNIISAESLENMKISRHRCLKSELIILEVVAKDGLLYFDLILVTVLENVLTYADATPENYSGSAQMTHAHSLRCQTCI